MNADDIAGLDLNLLKVFEALYEEGGASRAALRLDLTQSAVSAALGRRIVSQAGRHQFYTVRLDGNVALPAFKGSGDITSLSQADGYIEIPANTTASVRGSPVFSW